MYITLAFIFLGYLLGSILFAKVVAKVFHKSEIFQKSSDNNPGTANAFKYGGFACGVITLLGDLLKGSIPVYFYQKYGGEYINEPILTALVMTAPILGHAFPVFYKFSGGKGIAVTFGCLIGLFPNILPLIILACTFIFFSVVLKISPHLQRTYITYAVSLIALIILRCDVGIIIGFTLITIIVFLRLYMSREERKRTVVKLLWMH